MNDYNTPEKEDDQYGLEPELDPRESTEVQVLPIEGVSCKQCGYDLSGLSEEGVCPECGYSIERSLTEDLLENSSPGYLASLHLGVFLILTAIILKLLIFISAFAFGVTIAISGGSMVILSYSLLMASFLAAIFVAVGWWKFSAPDPAFTGQLNGSTSRKVVRVTTLIIGGVAVVDLPLQIMTGGSGVGSLAVISDILGIVSSIAWVTGFFAAMVYLRWLSPRIPDWRIHQRAKMLMWLEPILFTVGWMCFGLGPIIGIVLYWNLLNWVRLEIKAIRKQAEGFQV